MPPRYAYWTILVDDQPTAFRVRVAGRPHADLQAAEGEAADGDDDVVPERQALAVAYRCAGSDAGARRNGPARRRAPSAIGSCDSSEPCARSSCEPSCKPSGLWLAAKPEWKPALPTTEARVETDVPTPSPSGSRRSERRASECPLRIVRSPNGSRKASFASSQSETKAGRPFRRIVIGSREAAMEARRRSGPTGSQGRDSRSDRKPKWLVRAALNRPDHPGSRNATPGIGRHGSPRARLVRVRNGSRNQIGENSSRGPTHARHGRENRIVLTGNRNRQPHVLPAPVPSGLNGNRRPVTPGRSPKVATEKRKWVPKEEYKKSMGIEAKRDEKWRPGGEHKDPQQKYKDAKKAKWRRFKQTIRTRWEARGRSVGDYVTSSCFVRAPR